MGVIDLTSGDPQTDAERAAWLLSNGYQIVKSDSQEADEILATVSGEETEDEGQPRHPVTGQFISTQKGIPMSSIDLANASTLQKARDAEKDPVRKAQIEDRLTLANLRNFHTMRLLSKGVVQDSLHGVRTPQVAGRTTATGQSGAMGCVAQGVKTPASDASLQLGGQSTADIPIEARVTSNRMPLTTDGAAIVDPQAIAKGIAQLEGDVEKARDRRDEREVTRVSGMLTNERLRLFYLMKAAGQLGGSNNGGDVIPSVTARVDASDVGSVGTGVLPEYLAKAQRKQEKKAEKARQKRAVKAVVNKALAR